MVEINLEPNTSAELDTPASYNGFAFVIDGSVRIGDTELNTGQVGWLDRSTDVGTSVLHVVARESGARLLPCETLPSCSHTACPPIAHFARLSSAVVGGFDGLKCGVNCSSNHSRYVCSHR